jgi:hypothetical protein
MGGIDMGMRGSAQQIAANRGKATALNALAAACFSFVAISSAVEHPSRAPLYIVLWAIWMIVTAVWIFGVPGGFRLSVADRNVVNDELTRAHQALAARFGLTVAIGGLVALSLCSFLQVDVPAFAVPTLTSGTVVSTGLFFAWLQTRDG